MAGTIIVEISCDFPNPKFVTIWDDQIIVLPYPAPLPEKGICIFRRYEPGQKKDNNENFRAQMRSKPDLEEKGDLIVSTNRALQWEVRPNMRQVSVEYIKEEKRFILYLFYDQPLTEEEKDYDVAGTIITEVRRDFSDAEGIIWEEQIIVLPYPARIPHKGICIFCRYEPVPKEFSEDSH